MPNLCFLCYLLLKPGSRLMNAPCAGARRTAIISGRRMTQSVGTCVPTRSVGTRGSSAVRHGRAGEAHPTGTREFYADVIHGRAESAVDFNAAVRYNRSFETNLIQWNHVWRTKESFREVHSKPKATTGRKSISSSSR